MNLNELSKDELIKLIEDNENATGKYGLVWDKEKEPEKIVVECNRKVPILKEITNNNITKGMNNNILIEGDNFHSLSVLNYTHSGKIDIIYIDPPYNTGNKDFIYNDKFVDSEDGYKHSKWLNFMAKRLNLSKDLLKDNGLIFISIGDEEISQLRLLCDNIFGSKNFITQCVRVSKRTSNKGNYFKPTKDYVLVYAKNISMVNWKFGVEQSIDKKEYKYKDENGIYKKNGASLYQPSLDSRPNQRYWIECPDGSLIIPPGNVFPKDLKDGAFVTPKSNKDKVWRWSYQSYLKKKNNLIFTKASSTCPLIDSNGNKSKWNIYDKVYYEKKVGETLLPEDIIYDYVNSQGTKEVLDLGLSFSFAKPVGLIKFLIKLSQTGKDIKVLDFFAGSGTTGQAVMELNAEDGGHRQFILCTNNEGNICEDVTYPRLKTIITGIRVDGSKYSEGVKENLKCFKTDFVDNTNNRDQLYFDLTEKCIPMLCIKSECFNEYKSSNEYKIFTNDDKTRFACVYYSLFGEKEKEFIDEIKKIDAEKYLYKFSLADTPDLTLYKDVINFTVEAIPYKIVELYKRIVKLSKEN